MMAVILGAIRRHVPDQETRQALGREIRAAAELDNPEDAPVVPLRPLPAPGTTRDEEEARKRQSGQRLVREGT